MPRVVPPQSETLQSETPQSETPQSATRDGPFFGSALEILGLSAFAVGQPILELLGSKPEFFAVRRSLPLDILLLAVLACAGPALPFLGAELALTKIRPTWRKALHVAFVALFVAVIALPPLNRSLDAESAAGPLSVAGALGLLVALARWRFEATRWLLAFLATGLLVFPAVFLLRPGVSKMLTGSDHEISPVATSPPSLPVVLLIFDELPLSSLLSDTDTIDASRYPNFAALAGEATWFRRAVTVSDFTVQAVPSILTGRYPRADRLPTAKDHPNSLMTLLGTPGAANISESVTHLCPSSVCTQNAGASWLSRQESLWTDVGILYLHMLAPGDLASSLPPVHQNWMKFENRSDWLSDWKSRVRGDRQKLIDEFLAGMVPSAEGSLHILHVLLPHGPFEYLPSGRRYTIEGQLPGKSEITPRDREGAVEGYRRHLFQVGYVDRLLGEVVERLRAADLYDRSLLIVTADHGANFLKLATQRRHVTETTVAEILSVPLLIKAPGQDAGMVDDRLVETVDILPTIADYAGVSPPWPVDGSSLVKPGPLRDEITFFRYRTGSREVVAPDQIDQEPILRRIEEWLGPGVALGNSASAPGSLLGRAVDELPIADATGRSAVLEIPPQAFHIRPDAEFVPSHLVGTIESPDGGPGRPIQIAAAVNGRLQAVGRTRAEDGIRRFSILVPEDVYRPGDNQLQLFEVLNDGEEYLLAPLGPVVSSVAFRSLDLLFDRFPSVLGVEATGFHNPETWPDIGPVRWTSGRVRIQAPARLRTHVTALRLDLVSSGPDGTRLRIELDGRKIFARQLERLPEDRAETIRVPLPAMESGDLELELKFDTFVPKERYRQATDERELGVALAGLDLELAEN